MTPSNMYKSVSLPGIVESHSSCILLTISLVIGSLLGALPSSEFPPLAFFFIASFFLLKAVISFLFFFLSSVSSLYNSICRVVCLASISLMFDVLCWPVKFLISTINFFNILIGPTVDANIFTWTKYVPSFVFFFFCLTCF